MPKRKSPLTAVELRLRKLALGYPDTTHDRPWGEHAVKVKGKIFLASSFNEGVLRFTMKLPVSGTVALTLPFTAPTGYGLGKSGWVTSSFEEADDVPVDMLMEWMDESFRAVAPKRVLAKLDQPADDDEAAKPKRKGK